MKPVFLFVFLFIVQQLNAQGFTVGPYQDYSLSSPVVADFTGDSLPDVLGIKFNPNRVALQVNTAASPIAFAEKTLNLNIAPSGQPDAADMDGDLDMDVVIAQGTAQNLFVLKNDGAGNFTLDSLGVSGSDILKIGDVDHDMDLDIVGFNFGTGSIKLYVNDGSQHFSQINILSNASNLELFDIGDMDNDDDLDIVLGFYQFSGKQIVLYKNTGANNFEETILVSDDFNSIADLHIDDLNNDGKNDIVALKSFNCDALLNQGNLTFQRKNLLSPSGLVRRVMTGDYNGDGRKDIIIGFNSQTTTWHKNLSNTSLEFNTQTVGGVSPVFSVVNGDLDQDNDVDIVVSNGEFWWYENKITQEVGTITLSERAITVFPNPFSDFIQLKNLGTDLFNVEITDTHGRQVYAAPVSDPSIRLSQLSPGLYFFRLINATTRQVGSIVVIKQE